MYLKHVRVTKTIHTGFMNVDEQHEDLISPQFNLIPPLNSVHEDRWWVCS